LQPALSSYEYQTVIIGLMTYSFVHSRNRRGSGSLVTGYPLPLTELDNILEEDFSNYDQQIKENNCLLEA
jgi:hypothetical protein